VSRAIQLRSFFAVGASLAALAILWRFRPEWPALPGSLSSPVTTTLLHELALAAAWLLAALVILLLLVQSLGGIRARPRLNLGGVTWHTRAPPRSRSRRVGTPGILRPLAAEPSLLVAMPSAALSAPPTEDAVDSSSKPADVAAELDDRPLVSLLGPLTVHGGKQSRRGLRARALELIAFLALRREGAQRDEILEELWPGEDPQRSRHRLYQAVRDARRLLGDGVASERDRYWLDRTQVRVDIDDLEELLNEACKVSSSDERQAGENERSAELLEKALNLFRAEPLSGCDYAWSGSEIRRLRGTHAALLEFVGRARLRRGDARDALEAAEHGLTVDVLNEGLWRLALEAEGALGLREAVAGRYEMLRRVLDERLGLEPDRETRALYRQLLAQT
jgi:DNA-binding SARP family transcriptional activator